ncbi:hypothetical protein [Leptospira sp. GIMC2001]|uniref:hypothetical protein n=1 Tax=Leptospira sp. GIMC2001 TaxID=1513297 RepID=UPI002349AD24|nr:hypothetical protein [Leptospira sp. GIMC2001]WCL48469.1 hypothetical protein O4O04_14310 [Leptospira sp. GIMC2001]
MIIAVILSIQCSNRLEDRVDYTFDEKAQFNGGVYILDFSRDGTYPDYYKVFNYDKKLRLINIFLDTNMLESIYFDGESILQIDYASRTQTFTYEEACEFVRKNQLDVRGSISLEDCYGFWGKYVRRLGLIKTKKGF